MKRIFPVLSGVLFLSASLTASAASDRTPSFSSPPIVNWQAPAFFSATPAGGRTALTDAAPPMPYIPVVPCRQYDSRNSTVLLNNTPRTVTLSGAPCGIPTTAVAVAVNITVFNIVAAASNGVFKVGTVAPPPTAWINYPFSETQRGNAGVVSTTGPANIVVQVNQGLGSVDFVVDVFGYYGPEPATASNYFTLTNNSGNFTMFLTNLSAGCGGACGLLAVVNSGIAVFGETEGADARYGVEGYLGTAAAAEAAGVYGVSNSTAKTYGVLGATSGTVSGAAGVKGTGNGSGTFGVKGVNAATGSVGISGDGGSRGVEGNGAVDGSCGVCGNAFAGGISGSGVTALSNGNTFAALFVIGNSNVTGSKSFVEPHPLDASKQINYISLEGPEPRTFFTGRGHFERGIARIPVPEHFRMVTAEEGLTVQVTPIGSMASVAVLDVNLYEIVVQSSRNVEFFYTVNGIRAAFQDHKAVEENRAFRPDSAGAIDIRSSLSAGAKAAMVRNGSLNPDGSWSKDTAQKLGWKIPEAPAPEK